MERSMTPSVQEQGGMTDGQIDKAVDIFRSALRKHRMELGTNAVQQVLGIGELGPELLAVFRKRVEAVSDMIVRRVKVDRDQTPQRVLDATGRKQYTDSDVVTAMPCGEGEEVEFHFFKLGRYVNDNELEKEYELRGFKPADPYSLAAVNKADPAFADDHPNGTHWQDAKGRWCYAAFHRWSGERRLYVGRRAGDWDGSWWFAGLRK